LHIATNNNNKWAWFPVVPPLLSDGGMCTEEVGTGYKSHMTFHKIIAFQYSPIMTFHLSC